jgi:hypothetical protein
VIAHAVWLYHRFPLSYRDVELLFERGIQVCPTKPSVYDATGSAPTTPPGGATPAEVRWHLDKVFLKVNGRMRYRVYSQYTVLQPGGEANLWPALTSAVGTDPSVHLSWVRAAGSAARCTA